MLPDSSQHHAQRCGLTGIDRNLNIRQIAAGRKRGDGPAVVPMCPGVATRICWHGLLTNLMARGGRRRIGGDFKRTVDRIACHQHNADHTPESELPHQRAMAHVKDSSDGMHPLTVEAGGVDGL